MPSENGTVLQDVKRNLVISGREYLQAELPELHTGDTPRDISSYVAGLKDGPRKDALGGLATRLTDYQSGLETDVATPIDDPTGEARAIQESLMTLRPHVQLWLQIKGIFGAR